MKKNTLIYIISSALAWLSVTFHLYLVFSGLMPNLVSRPTHLLLSIPWVFFLSKSKHKTSRIIGYLIGTAGMAATIYIIVNQSELSDQYGSLYNNTQFIVAIVLLLTILEMARRAIKWPLPLAAFIALCYGVLGGYIPGNLGFSAIPIESFLGNMTIAEGGIWGSLTGISATIVSIFVIFGAVISAGEAGNGFMSLSTRIAGKYRGGAAKVSVISSALFGSISGSASANVASTGAFTLPTMKRLNYPAPFAAAVEAVSSTGGQIMPPLMGAGAFVMVELLQTTYTHILQAAILPAILFFYAVWAGIDAFSIKYKLSPMTKDELPSLKTLATTAPFFFIPFSILLYLLFNKGYTAQLAAGYAIFVAAALLITNRHLAFSIKDFFIRLNKAAISAAKQIASIASIIICAGIIIGVLNQTGLGVKITSLIISASGKELWVALLLTAGACLVLGMEVPTTAAYLICISVAGPALQELGLPPLTAHLFVFWYALLSTITPPVCGTVFIASGIADAPWGKTALISMQLGIGLYLIPLAMVAQPHLISPVNTPFLALLAFLRIGAGLWCLGFAVINRDRHHLLKIIGLILIAILLLFYPIY